jgi:hypothetical protein
MAVICSQCGASNRDAAKFCASCQAPLLQQSPLGQVAAVDRRLGFPATGLFVGAVCLIYLLNPTAGILELLPDNLPLIGNMDEVAAATGLLTSLASIGFIEWHGGKLGFLGLAGVRAKWRRP